MAFKNRAAETWNREKHPESCRIGHRNRDSAHARYGLAVELATPVGPIDETKAGERVPGERGQDKREQTGKGAHPQNRSYVDQDITPSGRQMAPYNSSSRAPITSRL